MPTCARCGAPNEGARAACFSCMAPLEGPTASRVKALATGTTLAEIAMSMPRKAARSSVQAPAAGKSKPAASKQTQMLLGVLAALIVLGIGVWMLFGRSTEEGAGDGGTTNSATTTTPGARPGGTMGAPPGGSMGAPAPGGAPTAGPAPPGAGPAAPGAGPAAPK